MYLINISYISHIYVLDIPYISLIYLIATMILIV